MDCTRGQVDFMKRVKSKLRCNRDFPNGPWHDYQP